MDSERGVLLSSQWYTWTYLQRQRQLVVRTSNLYIFACSCFSLCIFFLYTFTGHRLQVRVTLHYRLAWREPGFGLDSSVSRLAGSPAHRDNRSFVGNKRRRRSLPFHHHHHTDDISKVRVLSNFIGANNQPVRLGSETEWNVFSEAKTI